jgi:pyridoxine 4-dehydrogenase
VPAGTIRIGDLEVNRLGYGGMRLTGKGVWGPPPDPAGALGVLRRAVELGVTLIDTADSYGPNVNEEQIAEALHPYPDGLVIATKGGKVRPGPGEWAEDGRPEHLREVCEGSLRRLRLDRIDVYQLHAPDPKVPLEESVGALKELLDEGKIRHVGLSNVSVEELERSERIVPIVSVQNLYHADDRSSEDVLAACEQRGIPFLPWFPLAAGQARSPVDALVALLDRSPVMLPIPGTSSVAHLEENMRAAGLAH